MAQWASQTICEFEFTEHEKARRDFNLSNPSIPSWR